jgi:hypothetical protein
MPYVFVCIYIHNIYVQACIIAYEICIYMYIYIYILSHLFVEFICTYKIHKHVSTLSSLYHRFTYKYIAYTNKQWIRGKEGLRDLCLVIEHFSCISLPPSLSQHLPHTLSRALHPPSISPSLSSLSISRYSRSFKSALLQSLF